MPALLSALALGLLLLALLLGLALLLALLALVLLLLLLALALLLALGLLLALLLALGLALGLPGRTVVEENASVCVDVDVAVVCGFGKVAVVVVDAAVVVVVADLVVCTVVATVEGPLVFAGFSWGPPVGADTTKSIQGANKLPPASSGEDTPVCRDVWSKRPIEVERESSLPGESLEVIDDETRGRVVADEADTDDDGKVES